MLERVMRCLAAATIVTGLTTATAAAQEITYFRTDTPEFLASAKQGKQLFEAYQCALCHATREGQPLTKDIIAPNLILTKERLRPEWILEWLIDPQKLQPGTKMPNYFSFNTDDADNNILSDPDAHAQYKMIVSLRDYLMIIGTEKEAELARVGDDGRPIGAVRASEPAPGGQQVPAASPPAAQNAPAPEAAGEPQADAAPALSPQADPASHAATVQ